MARYGFTVHYEYDAPDEATAIAVAMQIREINQPSTNLLYRRDYGVNFRAKVWVFLTKMFEHVFSPSPASKN